MRCCDKQGRRRCSKGLDGQVRWIEEQEEEGLGVKNRWINKEEEDEGEEEEDEEEMQRVR